MKKLIFVVLVLLAILITPALTHASLADEITALRQQIATLQAKLADLLNQQTPNGWCYDFNRNFGRGEKGEVVDRLVKNLKPEISANYTEFNDNVLGWVKEFQIKYGIPNTGFVGVLTRAKLNELYGCKTNSGAPVINGISGPTSLKVGETGTWTVKVNNPTNSSLSYSVQWGDESKLLPSTRADAGASVTVQQTATFTHTYDQAGAYLPVFTISDRNGWIGASSISVKVTATDRFSIVVTSPNGGERWTTYDTKDITWEWPEAKRTDKVDIYLELQNFPTAPNSIGIPEAGFWTLDQNILARTTYHWIVATDVDNKKIPSGNYKVRMCQAGTNVCDSSDDYFTITQPLGTSGIFGRVVFTQGDCMPKMVDSNYPGNSNWTDPNPCTSDGVARELIVHKPVLRSVKPSSSSRVTTVTSNDQGYYALQLEPGQYSIYVNEKGKEWCNISTGNVYCLVTVNPDQVLEHNINIDYQAGY